MEARANGHVRHTMLTNERRREWLEGWDIMDGRIREVLKNAQSMLSEIQALRQPQMRMVAG